MAAFNVGDLGSSKAFAPLLNGILYPTKCSNENPLDAESQCSCSGIQSDSPLQVRLSYFNALPSSSSLTPCHSVPTRCLIANPALCVSTLAACLLVFCCLTGVSPFLRHRHARGFRHSMRRGWSHRISRRQLLRGRGI